MTTIQEIMWRCPLCGKEFPQTTIGSTSSFGAPDLDTRPPMLARETLWSELCRCPSCDFVGVPISMDMKPPPEPLSDRDAIAAIVANPRYGTLTLGEDLPEFAGRFLCRSMLHEAGEDFAQAGWLALKAAWACDDAPDLDGATRC